MKKKRSKPKPRRPPEALALMEKVKRQLEELKKPVVRLEILDKKLQVFPTVADYKRMDPYWLSTMGGKFAGRVVGRKVGCGKEKTSKSSRSASR